MIPFLRISVYHAVLLVLGLAVVTAAKASSVPSAGPLELSLESLSLDEEDPERIRVGRLIWRGGFALTSPDRRLGGISGLAVSADGDIVSMVTDRGYWIRLRARYDAAGDLRTIDDASIGRLRGPDGSIPRDKKEHDAETLERIPGGLAVGFEHDHRLWLYRATPHPFAARPTRIGLPSLLNRAHPNQATEALARLKDGRIVIFAEAFPRGTGDLLGWVRADEPPRTQWQKFRYRRNLLYRPTGAAVLPDGDLLLVERRFTWVGGFAARLSTIPASSIKPGAVLQSKELAVFEPPLLVDNFEGVDVRRDAKGRTMIYLVSDDNFTILQRTLLVMFELVD